MKPIILGFSLFPLFSFLVNNSVYSFENRICDPFPVFSWSGANHLENLANHNTHTTSLDTFAREIKASFIDAQNPPKIVLMIQQEWGGNMEDLEVSAMREVIRNAVSSSVRPFVYREEGQSLSSISKHPDVFGSSVREIKSLVALQNLVEENYQSYANGGTDVLLVSPDQKSDYLELINAADKILSKVTDGNHLIIHAPMNSQRCSNQHPNFHGHRKFSEVKDERRRLVLTPQLINTRYILMTPDILAGVLFGFLFIFIVLLGLTCLNSLQTPTTFAKVKPALGREF